MYQLLGEHRMKYFLALILTMICSSAQALTLNWNSGSFIDRTEDITSQSANYSNWQGNTFGHWAGSGFEMLIDTDDLFAYNSLGATMVGRLATNSPGLRVESTSQTIIKQDQSQFNIVGIDITYFGVQGMWDDLTNVFTPNVLELIIETETGVTTLNPFAQTSFDLDLSSNYARIAIGYGGVYTGPVSTIFNPLDSADNYGGYIGYEIRVASAPIPASGMLLLCGFLGLGIWRKARGKIA